MIERRPVALALAVSVLVGSPLPTIATGSSSPDETGAGRVVVGFEDRLSVAQGDPLFDGQVRRVDLRLDLVVLNTTDIAATLESARSSPLVAFAERDSRGHPTAEPVDDPQWQVQYGPQHVNAPSAWNATTGTSEVRICVIDNGVLYTHEDLNGSRWAGGIDYRDRDHDPKGEGHGTHVTGIAAATTDNGVGIAGLAQASFLAVRTDYRQSQVASGLAWCTDHGADVVNLSLGVAPSRTVDEAIEYAWDRGVLLVASAGNGGCGDCVGYPASHPDVVAVTCTNQATEVCESSSKGPRAELAAPGKNIVSTWSKRPKYDTLSGTSMSAPHVAGVAALAWSANPELGADQVREILKTSADDVGPAGHDPGYGHGLVNASRAVHLAANTTGQASKWASVYSEDFQDREAEGWGLGGLWSARSGCIGSNLDGGNEDGRESRDPFGPNPPYLAYTMGPERYGLDFGSGDAFCTQPATETSGSAVLPLDLPDADEIHLQFEHKIPSGKGSHSVDVSLDHGETWETLEQWSGETPGWVLATVSLAPPESGLAFFRFHYRSPDIAEHYTGIGWLVDDVAVHAEYKQGIDP